MSFELQHAHHLDRAQARSRVEALVRDLQAQVPLTCRWEGDLLVISHSGLHGHIEVTDALLHLRLHRRAWLPVSEAWLRAQVEAELRRHFPPPEPLPPPPANASASNPAIDLAATLLQGDIEGLSRRLLRQLRRLF
jgi:putative polyhydroxyalkanoate system protein